MRLFVAIELPDDLRRALAQVQERLARTVKAKWTAVEQFHLTVKFLGETADSRLPSVVEHLNAVRLDEPITLQTAGMVCFPPNGPIRIIASALNDIEGKCARLQQAIDKVCHAAGFPLEGRRWTPHVTVGRVKDRAAGARAIVVAEKLPGLDFEVEEFLLMESRLDQRGATYNRVASFVNAARRRA